MLSFSRSLSGRPWVSRLLRGRRWRGFSTGSVGEEEEKESGVSDSLKSPNETTDSGEKTVTGYTFEELLDRIARAQLRRDERILSEHPTSEKSRTTRQTEPLDNIDSLVQFLRVEDAQELCVIQLPPERDYVDYFVVCSAFNTAHIRTMAENLAAEAKKSLKKKGERVIVDGEDSDDWMAVDIGFAVVHVMLEDTREKYELEKLWTLGPQYDEQTQRMLKYTEEHMTSF